MFLPNGRQIAKNTKANEIWRGGVEEGSLPSLPRSIGRLKEKKCSHAIEQTQSMHPRQVNNVPAAKYIGLAPVATHSFRKVQRQICG